MWYEEKEKRKRDERILIYATKENKKRWEKTFPDFEVKNYEEALMLLLDLYEAASRFFNEKRLKVLVKKMREMGEYRLRIAEG